MASRPFNQSDADWSDAELVQACVAGQSRAWETLIQRYGRLVYSIPRRYGMTDQDVEDVFQTVFVRLYEKLDTLADQTKFSSWLITTTHRECWRIGKKGQSAAAVEEHIQDLGSPSDEQITAWERQDLVNRGLRELGDPCRTLLIALFSADGRPNYETIAAKLNVKVGSIGPTRARCFSKLEVILRRLGFDDE